MKRILMAIVPVTLITAFVIAGIKHDTDRQLPTSQGDYYYTDVATTCENIATSCDVSETEYLIPYYSFSFFETEAETELETTEAETEAPTEVETAAEPKLIYNVPLSEEMQNGIQAICEEYQISFELVLGIIKVESNFHTDSIGDDGKAIGLMQIQPQWWQGVADEMGLDIYNPIDNVRLGVHILSSHLNALGGDLTKALIKYNTGLTESESGRAYAFRVYEAMLNIKGVQE